MPPLRYARLMPPLLDLRCCYDDTMIYRRQMRLRVADFTILMPSRARASALCRCRAYFHAARFFAMVMLAATAYLCHYFIY